MLFPGSIILANRGVLLTLTVDYTCQVAVYRIARKSSPFRAGMDSAGGVAALNPCFLRIIRLERPHNDLQSY